MQRGRPRIYTSVDELEEAIESYFFVDNTIYVGSKCGKPDEIPTGEKTMIAKPTVTGLALHLGFADKTTLYEYRDRPEFSYSIKRALTIIENYHESNLDGNNVTGRIFALKNMGWRDKVETGFTDNEGKDVPPVQIYLPDNGRTNTAAKREQE